MFLVGTSIYLVIAVAVTLTLALALLAMLAVPITIGSLFQRSNNALNDVYQTYQHLVAHTSDWQRERVKRAGDAI